MALARCSLQDFSTSEERDAQLVRLRAELEEKKIAQERAKERKEYAMKKRDEAYQALSNARNCTRRARDQAFAALDRVLGEDTTTLRVMETEEDKDVGQESVVEVQWCFVLLCSGYGVIGELMRRDYGYTISVVREWYPVEAAP